MLKKEDILVYLKENKTEFKKQFKITKIGLFGSYAKDAQTDSSDIDLIVEFAPNTEELAEKKMQMKIIVKNKFNKEVDIAREKYLKPYYKEQIMRSVIYA